MSYIRTQGQDRKYRYGLMWRRRKRGYSMLSGLARPFAEECRLGFPHRQKSLRHMVVPGEILFVEKGPQHSHAAGANAQPASNEAQRPAGSVRTHPIEIDETEFGPVLPGRFPAAQGKQQAI